MDIGTLVKYGFLINVLFAAFNMLPIKFLNLDGGKIWDWNKRIWGITAAVCFIGVLMAFVGIW